MTAAAQNIDDMLGPEPEITEEQEVIDVQPEVVEEQQPVTEQVQEEQKPAPEDLVSNYKRMAHAERMERQKLAEQMSVMQQRFEQLIAAQQPAPEPEPVYEDDPLGATFSKVDKVAKTVESLQTEAAQRKQADEYQRFVSTIQQEEANFMQANPDYRDAVTFVQQRRMNELQAMGYDESSAMQVLAQDAYAVTMRAQQMGQSPAAFVYDMAKKLGYAAQPKQNLEQIAAGQQVAKSVAGGAQPVAEGGLPPNLAEMSDADFDVLFNKMIKSK